VPLPLPLPRHAKSSWDVAGQDDHDRALNGRGRKAAHALGEFLAREGPQPDRVLCSTATRARETWERLEPSLPGGPAVEIERGLYLAGAGELLARLQACGDEPCVMMVAHNPGIEELARRLAGSGDEAAWRRLRDKYPTGGLATFAFGVTRWADARAAGGELLRFVVPRDL